MTPARLADYHLREARASRATGFDRSAQFHLTAALLIIARCSGGNTRREAARLLRIRS